MLYYKLESGKYNLQEGENSKVLVVLPQSIIEEDDLLLFLKKILGAVHIDYDKIHRLFLGDDPILFQSISSLDDIEHVLFFGIEPRMLGWNIDLPFYQIITCNKRELLKSTNLDQLQKEVRHKKSLWNALQKLFLQK